MLKMMLCVLSVALSHQLMAASVRLEKCYEIAGQTGTAYAPAVAINEQNAAVVMWVNADGDGNQILVDVNCNKSSWGWLPSQQMVCSLGSVRGLQCAIDSTSCSRHMWVSESTPKTYELHFGRGDAQDNHAAEEGAPMFFEPSSYRVAMKQDGEPLIVRFLRQGTSKPKFTLQEYSPHSGGWIAIAPASKRHCFYNGIFLDQFAIGVDRKGGSCAVWEEQVYPCAQVCFSQKMSEGEWSLPISLYTSSKGVYLSDLKASLNDRSEVAVLWSSFAEAGGGSRIEAVVRNQAGSWGQSQTLIHAQQDIVNPNVLLDSEGNALAVWEVVAEDGNQIMGVYRPHDQQWGEPMVLSASGAHHCSPKIQVTALNEFVVVWEENLKSECSVHARVFDGLSWSNDQVLTLGKKSRQPAVAIAGSYGIIAWLKASSGGVWKVNYAHFGVH